MELWLQATNKTLPFSLEAIKLLEQKKRTIRHFFLPLLVKNMVATQAGTFPPRVATSELLSNIPIYYE